MVRIPETVIRIEDYAFRDCTAIQEMYLPYYIEYISPLAFTNSDESEPFYLCIPNVHIPKDAFRKYAYLGSAELLSVHRQRVADVDPHSDDNDEKPPYFGQDKTKFPQELHHVFDDRAHSRPASCCIWKLGSYVIGSIDSLASTE